MHPIDDLKDDIKEVKGILMGMAQTLAENTASLRVHEARTTAAEKRLEHVESAFKWFIGLVLTGVASAVSHLFIR